MAELRFNPLTSDWVMIASHRQNRPQMPKDWCPFCPGSGKVPESFDVYKYDNDFPALSQSPPVPDDVATSELFKTAPCHGKCEVILYSPEHTITLPELPRKHILKLVNLWCERFEEIQKDEKIKYIFIFENRGDVVGVTMPHPHGQIYGYPFIPKKMELILENAAAHKEKTGNCMICDMLDAEIRDSRRIIFENDDFVTFLPFFSEYPYGVNIAAKRHVQNITELSDKEKASFADILKCTTGMLDNLFDYNFPYMMCMYQNPVNGGDYKDISHFFVAFYPPMRSRDKIKFNASSETGAWAHCNPTCPEETAKELRAAYEKFCNKENK